MSQMKRTSFRPKPGKAGSGVKKATGGPSFRPGAGKACVPVESPRERKDRLLG